MGALLPVCAAAVDCGLRDRRDLVGAGPLVGHVAAARRATAGLAVDGSALCEYLPGRAARAPRRRPGPAYPDDAGHSRHGDSLPDLLLLPPLCAAPRSRRRRNMGGTAPVRTRARPAVASAAFVSRDLGDPHCGRNRRMAGPRLGTLDLLELRDHRNSHVGGFRCRAGGEHIANSWREWRLGPLRIINHGVYGAVGAFLIVAIAGTLMGPDHAGALVVTSAAALAGAGLWAQFVEGSPRLLRPFGFYGGLFAVMAASLLSSAPMLIMAAFCVGAPWLQAMGRLRCLVQGCCHGRPARPDIGIRYVHLRSRVCRLADLKGVPLHPTPLYSILWNVVIAMVVTRLWVVHAPLGLIGGLYLILTGIGRFSEEGYRGEPQTPVLAGLRLYQWIAIGTVLCGAAITALAPGSTAPAAHFSWTVLAIAAAFGAVSMLLLGVDAPQSPRRFARLT